MNETPTMALEAIEEARDLLVWERNRKARLHILEVTLEEISRIREADEARTPPWVDADASTRNRIDSRGFDSERIVRDPKAGNRIQSKDPGIHSLRFCWSCKHHRVQNGPQGQMVSTSCGVGINLRPETFVRCYRVDSEEQLLVIGVLEALQGCAEAPKETVSWMMGILRPSDAFAKKVTEELGIPRDRKIRRKLFASGMTRDEVRRFVEDSVWTFRRMGIYPFSFRAKSWEEFREVPMNLEGPPEPSKVLDPDLASLAIRNVSDVTGSDRGCPRFIPRGNPAFWNQIFGRGQATYFPKGKDGKKIPGSKASIWTLKVNKEAFETWMCYASEAQVTKLEKAVELGSITFFTPDRDEYHLVPVDAIV